MRQVVQYCYLCYFIRRRTIFTMPINYPLQASAVARDSAARAFAKLTPAQRASGVGRAYAQVLRLSDASGQASLKAVLEAIFPLMPPSEARRALTTQIVNRPPKDAQGNPVLRLKHTRVVIADPQALVNARIWFEAHNSATPEPGELAKPVASDLENGPEATRAAVDDDNAQLAKDSATPVEPPQEPARWFAQEGTSLCKAELNWGRITEQHGIRQGAEFAQDTPASEFELVTGDNTTGPTHPVALNAMLAWARDQAPTAKRLLLLTGDYGAGKTTHAQAFTRVLNGDLPHTNWPQTDAALPNALYIDLAELAGASALGSMSLEDMVLYVLKKRDGVRLQTIDDIAPYIAASRAGQLVFVFDGLDELLENDAQVLQQAFGQLLRALELPSGKGRNTATPRPKAVISCRTHYFRSVQEQFAFFTSRKAASAQAKDYLCLTLQPWGPSQVQSYLEKRLSPAEVQPLLTQIDTTYNLKDLAGRPVLLAMMTEHIGALMRQREAGEKITAASVYSLAVGSWIDRDHGKHRIRAVHKPLLMGALAHAMWQSGEEAWSAERLDPWVARTVNLLFSGEYAPQDMQGLQDDLRTATFIVRPGAQRFAFAHRSFAEYFLARFWLDALDHTHASTFSPAEAVAMLQTMRSLLASRELNRESAQFLQELNASDVKRKPERDRAHRSAYLWHMLRHSDTDTPEGELSPAPELHKTMWQTLISLGHGSAASDAEAATLQALKQATPATPWAINLRSLDIQEILLLEVDFAHQRPPLDIRNTNLRGTHARQSTLGPVISNDQTIWNQCVFRNCTFKGFEWGNSMRLGLVVRSGGDFRFDQGLGGPWSRPGALGRLGTTDGNVEVAAAAGDPIGGAALRFAFPGNRPRIEVWHMGTGALIERRDLTALEFDEERRTAAISSNQYPCELGVFAGPWDDWNFVTLSSRPGGARVLKVRGHITATPLAIHSRIEVTHPIGLFEPSWAEFDADGNLLACSASAVDHWLYRIKDGIVEPIESML